MVDTDLPRSAKKRKKYEEEQRQQRREEVDLIRAAVIARGEDPTEEIADDDLEEIIDETINKANSITVSKTTLGGYKSALKLYYFDNNVEFACPEMPPNHISLDKYLNEQIKSYGNLLADKKERNIMPLREGKTAMTEEGFNEMLRKMALYQPPPNNPVILLIYLTNNL